MISVPPGTVKTFTQPPPPALPGLLRPLKWGQGAKKTVIAAKMDPCYIYEQQFWIHESICITATQVPGVCFKVLFKLQLFAEVNPAPILTAINKTFEN